MLQGNFARTVCIHRVAKSVQTSSGQNFQSLHKPSSKCCTVGLSSLTMRMKLDHYFFKKEGMISGIDYHLLFFVILVFRIHYVVCGHETFLTDCPFCKPSSRVTPAYPWLFCNSVSSLEVKNNAQYLPRVIFYRLLSILAEFFDFIKCFFAKNINTSPIW